MLPWKATRCSSCTWAVCHRPALLLGDSEPRAARSSGSQKSVLKSDRLFSASLHWSRFAWWQFVAGICRFLDIAMFFSSGTLVLSCWDKSSPLPPHLCCLHVLIHFYLCDVLTLSLPLSRHSHRRRTFSLLRKGSFICFLKRCQQHEQLVPGTVPWRSQPGTWQQPPSSPLKAEIHCDILSPHRGTYSFPCQEKIAFQLHFSILLQFSFLLLPNRYPFLLSIPSLLKQ